MRELRKLQEAAFGAELLPAMNGDMSDDATSPTNGASNKRKSSDANPAQQNAKKRSRCTSRTPISNTSDRDDKAAVCRDGSWLLLR
jgi:hypothetical protein